MVYNFLEKEWIHTNGTGGYASASVSGANTRRYHGLLVATLNPPTGRNVLISKIDEEILLPSGIVHRLGTNQYPNAIYPEGYQYIKGYTIFPYPSFAFQNEDFNLTKSIYLKRLSNTVFVEYVNQGSDQIQLSLKPQFVHRDYHGFFQENPYFDFFQTDSGDDWQVIYAYNGAVPLYQKITKGVFSAHREWIKNVEYEEEKKRGLDFHEDYYALGSWTVSLQAGEKVVLMFSTDREMYSYDPEEVKKEILAHQKMLTSPENSQFFNDLLLSGDQFVVKRESTQSHTLMAGYHWFTDWGRDTMIAMRGITIATGNQEISRSILQTFFQYLNQGMLPNRFPDNPNDEPEYNTVDATLWLFIVMYEYYRKFEDLDFIRDHFERFAEIIQFHLDGTRYNIHTTREGFLYAGEGLSQLTWMDVRIGEYVVTPRHGCPVEVNALWYNALRIYQYFSQKLSRSVPERIIRIIDEFPMQFRKYFFNHQGYLNDVVNPEEFADDSIRPNQIYTLSLPFTLLDEKDSKSVMETVEQHLFTPLGLRTLNMENYHFKSNYTGGVWDRDTAYHQGTVWPFLWNEYWIAKMKLATDTEKVKQDYLVAIESLKFHFYTENCLYGISEVFDGKNPQPHLGKGTVQQAWSLSGLIKSLVDFGLTGKAVATNKQLEVH